MRPAEFSEQYWNNTQNGTHYSTRIAYEAHEAATDAGIKLFQLGRKPKTTQYKNGNCYGEVDNAPMQRNQFTKEFNEIN